jgi:predicted nucleic acid-binding protein
VTVGLDTSVVVRLLVGAPAEQTARALRFLDDLRRRGDRAVVSDVVVAEAYYAVHYHYGVRKGEALRALRRMFDDGEIASAGAAADVLASPGIASARPGFVDRLIHRGYESAGNRMATFERASGRLPSVTVV